MEKNQIIHIEKYLHAVASSVLFDIDLPWHDKIELGEKIVNKKIIFLSTEEYLDNDATLKITYKIHFFEFADIDYFIKHKFYHHEIHDYRIYSKVILKNIVEMVVTYTVWR